ncbi:MAG: hypothetical protein AAGF76_14140 [Pseudomonadota bacterium]
MTDWDPYYFDRGIRRPLPAERRERRAFTHERVQEARASRDDLRADEAAVDSATAAVVIREQAAIQRRLAQLEAANTEALMRNTEALDAVRDRIRDLLEKAFMLPDGRRVFRTEDGTQVFDEDGQAVSPEEIHPDEIDDAYPSWEDYRQEREAEAALEAEREDLLEEQQRLDEAREHLDQGELTAEDLDGLEAELGPAPNAQRVAETEARDPSAEGTAGAERSGPEARAPATAQNTL